MAKLFKTTGYLLDSVLETEGGQSLNFKLYPPFLRVLLTTDGTVTKSLESFFWEPVNVTQVSQKKVVLESACIGLDKPAAAQVFQRDVSLMGQHSENIYTRAQSLICLDELPKDVAESLESGKVGIGELLRDCGLETYREILAFGEHDIVEWGGEHVWRTYRIVIHSQPIIQVTEWFPKSLYQV